MSAYLPSALRYRPQRFDEVLGQTAPVRVLQQAIRLNRIANVYLFSGPRGTGKTSLARLFAKAINCDDLERQKAEGVEKPEPCNACRSCEGVTAGKDSEVLEIDAASHGGVDDVKELQSIALQQPRPGKWRILILDEAHALSSAAQSALLLLFEAPPKNFLPILCTTDPDKLLPTIRSRCSPFALKPLGPAFVRQSLERIFAAAGQTITPDALTALVQTSGGSLRGVQQTADLLCTNADGQAIDDDFLDIHAGIPSLKLYRRLGGGLISAWEDGPAPWFELVEDLFYEGYDLRLIFFQALTSLLRDLRVALVSRGRPEPCVPYWTGIAHETFETRAGGLTMHDLDLLDQAWNEQEKLFSDGIFERYILEFFLIKAWDSKRFESGVRS